MSVKHQSERFCITSAKQEKKDRVTEARQDTEILMWKM